LVIVLLGLANTSSAETHGTHHARLIDFLVGWVDVPLLHILPESGTVRCIEMLACPWQEEPTSSRPYAFACDEKNKGMKKAPTPSSSSEEEEEESDDDEDNQPSTSSSEDEETIWRIGKVMGMIRKNNLMDVPLQVEDLLLNIDRKKQRKRGYFACGEKCHFRTAVQTWPNPQRGGAKAKCLQVSKLGMTLQAKMNLQGHAATDPHHAHHGHHASALWQEVK
jgi:hypothetical protein